MTKNINSFLIIFKSLIIKLNKTTGDNILQRLDIPWVENLKLAFNTAVIRIK